MRSCARPAPFVRRSGETCLDRVVLDITDRNHEVRFVHRITSETILEQVSAGLLAIVDSLRKSRVNAAHYGAQSVGGRRFEDEVDVIGHQAPGEAFYRVHSHRFGEHLDVAAAIAVRVENTLLAVAALDYVMSKARDDDPGGSGHSM